MIRDPNPISTLQRVLLITPIVICVAIELGLTAADYGIFGTPRLRQLTYEYAGFWPGLLRSWDPNYTAQPYLMFLTYGFLHSGPGHLVVNMFSLWSLGYGVLSRVGGRGFVLLWIASVLGGGAGFGLLAPNLLPMVGASGVLFGLAGGLLAWGYIDRFTFQEGLWPIAQVALLLLGLNLVMWWAMDGQLAWETHLGGFVAGWVMAFMIDPRPRDMPEEE